MIDLPYNLVIEATGDPSFYRFYSPDLPNFSSFAHSVEECIYDARRKMPQHIAELRAQETPLPVRPPCPVIVIRNEESLVS